jgi:hypothetical protein
LHPPNVDELRQRGLADPYVPTNPDELNPPLSDQTADEPRRSTQPIRSGIDRK